jgi:hypothetical protein
MPFNCGCSSLLLLKKILAFRELIISENTGPLDINSSSKKILLKNRMFYKGFKKNEAVRF